MYDYESLITAFITQVSEPEAVAKRKRLEVEKAPIGDKTPCPMCDKKFARKYVVKRYLEQMHNLTKAQILEFDKEIHTTSEECLKCGKFFSNVWKHQHDRKNKCPGKLTKETENLVPSDAPTGYEPGGKLFMPGFLTFLKQNLGPVTAQQYYRKGVEIGTFWEERKKNFKMDKLMAPLETNCMFPSLRSYLAAATTEGDKNTATKANKWMAEYAVEVFEER